MAFDAYKTLGVAKDATQDQIKSAYRKLAKKNHPDLNPGNKEAETRFKDATRAYEMIGTEDARKKYDAGGFEESPFGQGASPGGAGFGAQGFGGFGGAQGRGGPFYYQTQDAGGRYGDAFGGGFSGDPEDILESLFGRARGGGARRAKAEPTRGEDAVYQMEVEFKDSVLGAEREIQLPHGKKLRVKIPAGIESGKKLRFAGMGHPGVAGANGGGTPAGDAIVEIVVRPSPQFRRTGPDLEVDVAVPFPQAVVGGEVRVPTVEGAVMLKIPPRSAPGTRLRLRSKGVKDEKSQTRGDLYAVVRLGFPEHVDTELEDALKAYLRRHSAQETQA